MEAGRSSREETGWSYTHLWWLSIGRISWLKRQPREATGPNRTLGSLFQGFSTRERSTHKIWL